MKRFLFVIIFLIALVSAVFIVYREGVLPVNREDKSDITFVVRKGDTVNQIINNLAIERLIRNRLVTYLIIKRLGIERDIQAGSFKLNRSMDTIQVVESLTKATDDLWVTIQEGLRKEEIAEKLTKDLPEFSAAEFVSKAQEGYLFPDTYLVPKSADAEYMISLLTNTFYDRFTNDMKLKAKQIGYSEKEVVTLASLVEREALGSSDRQQIASIMLRRLKEPMRLQVDATVQYALGYQKGQKSWWKRPLYEEDLQTDSSYNTYTRDGIPPAPISNPGLASIKAVLEGDPKTKYLFYLHDDKGNAYYAETFEKHLEYKAKYIDGK